MQKNININNRNKIKNITLSAIFVALAYGANLITSFIPKVSNTFSLDAKDAIMVISGYVLSPIYALVISVITCLFELIFSSTTGWYGFFMNLVSSSTFVLVASMFYSKKRKINTAVWGLVLAVLTTTVVMMCWDYFIIPLYTPNVTSEIVLNMILPIILPFNLVKYSLNASLTMIIYKPISKALTRAKFINDDQNNSNELSMNKRTIIVVVSSLIVIAISILILLVLYGII